MADQKMTVGRYLVRRLEQLNLKHIFGVPGDYVLRFMDLIEDSSISLINTCNELNAGYAADGYARIAGLGAACITYGVGGFSIYNAVAGPSPNGSPSSSSAADRGSPSEAVFIPTCSTTQSAT